MKVFILTILIVFGSLFCHAQKRNNIWCFGDSALVDFNDTANILTGRCNVISRGSCASICDSTGQLLFYSSYDDDVYTSGGPPFNGGEIFTKQHQTMQNGDSIVMGLWYNEVVIVNVPSSLNLFYVFSVGVTGNYGLYYSVVDMSGNGGNGIVTQKNVQLQTPKSTDCITAIKHGNGRDWWIFYRRWDTVNNDFYTYLISPSGISLQSIQSVGTASNNGFLTMTFSAAGNKLAVKTFTGLIELYDFDRCTGIISNPITIENEVPSSPYPQYVDCEFSPDGNLLYVSSEDITNRLFQYHLNDPLPSQTRDTIYSYSYPTHSGGLIRLAPDGKIYWSCAWNDGVHYNYPYPDTTYNMYNMNLSVINSPDSPGMACNFTPFSFYLGGARTYYGLPNNPDYDMKPLYGSVCDSLSAGIESLQAPKGGELSVTFISDWQKAFINGQHLKGTTYTLSVIDITGRQIFKEKGGLRPPYYTKDLDCSGFSKGIYIVTLQTAKERLVKKFVKN